MQQYRNILTREGGGGGGGLDHHVYCTLNQISHRNEKARIILSLSVLCLTLDGLSLVLFKLDVVSAAVGILLHLEVVCGEAEGAEDHVAELLQVLHHLGFQFLVALFDHGGEAPRRSVRLHVAGIELQHFLVVG